MRDLFEDIFAAQPLDPVEASRRSMRTLRRRFYKSAGVAETQDGFAVELDGRPVRTPARRVLSAPALALAQAVAAEWDRQGDVIDPARMPVTRLANTVLDGVAGTPEPVREEITRYLNSDLLFYRADAPERLVAWQSAEWDPFLTWAREQHGARFLLSEGVVFVRQPAEAVAALRAAIPGDAWRLGAVAAITTLTGSAVIALALAADAVSADAAWSAAHVDEDWNMALWGRDELAMARRAFRRTELDAAACVLRLVPPI